ncbi:MAG: oxalate/formate MFS antiporter [Deltaproteobacteria bacterium]|nr:oxalate/formate MFS antiporter [Deltaproteobacteria bacterium]
MPNESMTRTEVTQDSARQLYGNIAGNRWIQLIAGVVGMVIISNYQYAFPLFAKGMKEQFVNVPYRQIALVFSAFILFETWPMPISGFLVDKFGIRKLMTLGSVCILLGWLLGGTLFKDSLFGIYACYGLIAGTGAGIIYICAVSNAVKWFPDRRGLATGLTAAGFGGGAAFSILPIQATMNAVGGWAMTMAIWGVGQGIIGICMAMVLRHPPTGWKPVGWQPGAQQGATAVVQSRVEFTWTETLMRPEFYALYVAFLCMGIGGLMSTANMVQMAKSFNLADAKVLGIGIIALTAAMASAMNATSRVLWGFLSDKLGREYTMALAFTLEAVFVFLVTKVAGSPVFFVVAFSLVFLCWGEIYALFPAVTGDVFGAKNSGSNYGMMYTSKGVGSIIGGYGAAALAGYFAGSFIVPYYIAAGLNVLAAVLMLFIMMPLVRSRIAKESHEMA